MSGGVFQQIGDVTTPYGFTGEMEEPNNMLYLRARHYHHDLGRFISQDPVEGSINDPMSLNQYAYAHNNPVNRTDPSGLVDCSKLPFAQQVDCIAAQYSDLRNNFGILFTESADLSLPEQRWTPSRIAQVYDAVHAINAKLTGLTRRAIGDIELYLVEQSPGAEAANTTACNKLTLYLNYTGVPEPNAVHTANNLIHEFGHVLSLGSAGRSVNSEALGEATDMHNRPVALWDQIRINRGFPETAGWADTWWERSPGNNEPAEVVADMFLYWVRGYPFDTTANSPGDVRLSYAEGFNLNGGEIPALDGSPLRRIDGGNAINDGSVIKSAGFEEWARQATCSPPTAASLDPLLKQYPVGAANNGWCK